MEESFRNVVFRALVELSKLSKLDPDMGSIRMIDQNTITCSPVRSFMGDMCAFSLLPDSTRLTRLLPEEDGDFLANLVVNLVEVGS
jgi:hypothetical protein